MSLTPGARLGPYEVVWSLRHRDPHGRGSSALQLFDFVERDPKTDADIWYWSNPGDPTSKPEKFSASAATETQPQLSPDGRWLAYVSSETGVTVRQFPSGPGFIRIGPGVEPRWKKDGLEERRI